MPNVLYIFIFFIAKLMQLLFYTYRITIKISKCVQLI